MKAALITLIQNSEANNTGYNIGYAIGQNLPYVIILVFAFIAYRYFKNKSKK